MPVPAAALCFVIAARSSLSIAACTRLSTERAVASPRRAGVHQPVVEHLLHTGDAAAIEIGPAEDVRGEHGLRVEPLGFARKLDGGLANRVHRRHQLGQRRDD
jgi:hypothetical protein